MQQAMLISAMAVLNPGETAWIEDPCYQQTRRVLSLAGVKIAPKAIDNQGILIERSSKESLPRMIYVTPSHQFPLGVTMSLQRRTDLLDLRVLTTRSFSKTITTPNFASSGRHSPPCKESTTPVESSTPAP